MASINFWAADYNWNKIETDKIVFNTRSQLNLPMLSVNTDNPRTAITREKIIVKYIGIEPFL